jgi:hypothetical protein
MTNDPSGGGVPVTLYRVEEIPSKQKLYKIDINAQQNHLTGARYRGDVGEMSGRCRGDVGEMWGRCGGDVGAGPLRRRAPCASPLSLTLTPYKPRPEAHTQDPSPRPPGPQP